MVDLLRRQTLGTFVLPAIFFQIMTTGIKGTARNDREERLASSMLGSLKNSTRHRDIEEFMRNYLQNDPEPDNSFLHVIVHPKVNPQTVQAVLKACSEIKSIVIHIDDKIIVYRGCDSNITCSRISRVVGIYEEVDDMDPLGWKKMYGISWNSRAKIAIWLGRDTNRDVSLDKIKFEKTLASFWSINVVNVILLVMPWCDNNCTDNAKPRVFGYDPFVPVGPDKRGKLFERSPDDPLFPDKLKNLQGAPIRVSMYHHEPNAVLNNNTEMKSGRDVHLIRYVSGWMNFTIELVTSSIPLASYTTQTSSGEMVGPVGDILNNRSDYVGNADYIEGTFGRKVEFLRPVGQKGRVFIVPQAGRMPSILRTFRGFDVVFAGATLLISLGLVCYFVATKKHYPVLSVFRLLMHQQIKGIGKKTPQRIFLISWIIWASVISIVLQTQFLKDLTNPPFYKNIDSIKELEESALTCMANEIDIRNLKVSKLASRESLGMKCVLEPNVSRCIETLKAKRNVACVVDEAYAYEIVKKFNKKLVEGTTMRNNRLRGDDVIHVAAEHLTHYMRTLIVQDGFPYLHKFDDGYFRAIDWGLLSRWRNRDTSYNRKSDQLPTKLGLDHFEGTFTMLFIGHGIAFLIFLAEFLCHWANKSRECGKNIPPAPRIFLGPGDRYHRRRLRFIRTLRVISLRTLERL